MGRPTTPTSVEASAMGTRTTPRDGRDCSWSPGGELGKNQKKGRDTNSAPSSPWMHRYRKPLREAQASSVLARAAAQKNPGRVHLGGILPLSQLDENNRQFHSNDLKLLSARSRLSARLVEAARSGDADTVRSCLLQGAAADTCDDHGWAALHYSAAAGHLEVCRVLVEFGCDVNALLPDRSTPLMLAAEEAQMPIAQLLLDKSALIACKDDIGFTALDRCDARVWEEFASFVWESPRG